ncbi:MAG: hypothetical protein KBT20_01240 [Bacteroidales bacterium]|nr:hypothetical protein [Candidatus Liminaster caballi]
MKKFFRNMAFVGAMALSGAFFASCDEDTTTSMVLSGDWTGNFGMCYDYEWRGHYYTYDSYHTDISFVPSYDYSTSGYGYQVDHYNDGPYEVIYHYFTWKVEHKTIYLTYLGERDLNTCIYEYKMTNNSLTGYFDNASQRFSLRKVADYYDWTPYINEFDGKYYGSRRRDSWYNSHTPRTRAEAADIADEAMTEEGTIVRIGNRFSEGRE